MNLRYDWKLEEVKELYLRDLDKLVTDASAVHEVSFPDKLIFRNALLSVKTGACVEDCAYCAQSSRYCSGVKPLPLMEVQGVFDLVDGLKQDGVPRVCLSASWKHIPEGKVFHRILDMVKGIRERDLHVCATLGTLNPDQALMLKEAGLSAYNHNIDTSKRFYPEIITTRTFQERIDSIMSLIETGLPYCSGGIIGMGENMEDRCAMLQTLANLPEHPFELPVNRLVPIKGTPLEGKESAKDEEMIRMIAMARIMMPATRICLAAGRGEMSIEAQEQCFKAGANAVFAGDKLLTTPNPGMKSDEEIIRNYGYSLEK